MATSGTINAQQPPVRNDGWWTPFDPYNYYVEAPVVLEFPMEDPSVDAGLGIYRIDLYANMGDLGPGIDVYIKLGGTILQGGHLDGCGANQYGGANSCGMRYVATWQTSDPAQFIKPPASTDLRAYFQGVGGGNQQHYIFQGWAQMNWFTKSLPRRRQYVMN